MPPRLQMQSVCSARPVLVPTFLLPFLSQQSRNASILSSLSDTPGSYNRKIRRGRGPSSGKGKTAGRGNNGQKKRGGIPLRMQGGQTSVEVSHGKEGFVNQHAIDMSPVNLDRIQDWINQGRIDPTKPITLQELASTRAIHGIKDGVKLLARGATALTTPIHLVVSRASQSAIAAVEALGGTVTTRFYTKSAITRIRANKSHPYVSLRWDPEKINNPALDTVEEARTPEGRVKGVGFEYRLPDPTSRKEMEYYRDPKHRGYLSHTIKPGEGPSLYFKPPKIGAQRASGKPKQLAKEDNRLW